MFNPSDELTKLISDCIESNVKLLPDEELILISEMVSMYNISERDLLNNTRKVIIDLIDSLLICLAKKGVNELGEKHFNNNAKKEIIHRLGININDDILDILYKEIYEYSLNEQDFIWGNLKVLDNKICLIIKKEFTDSIEEIRRKIDEILKEDDYE